MIERFIAGRYLRTRKGSGFAYVVTWFSFIGIALGVATLIIVTSVMNGFRSELLDKIVGMKGHIVISPIKNDGLTDYAKLADFIKTVDKGIMKAIPQIEQQVVLISNGNARGVLVQGLTKESLKQKNLVSDNIKYGKLNDFSNQNVFIGKRLAETLNVKIGESIKLLIPDGLITPFGKLPKEENFYVSGIFEVGMNEYDKNIILMPLQNAQEFFNLENRVSHIELFLSNVDQAKSISKKLASNLDKNLRILDWQHSDASIFHAVTVEKNVMTLILSIIILVAIFNIISGLTMLTNSKTKDIAILRTMGITQRSISKIFFIIGSSIGVLGTSTGVGLGLLVSLNIDSIKRFLERLSDSDLFNEEIYFLSQIPSQINWIEVLYIVLFSITFCLLATIYPAKKASKMDPVDALKV